MNEKTDRMDQQDKAVEPIKGCGKECQVYSRVVGYFRPVQMWNNGKTEEFKDRLEYDEKKSIESKIIIGKVKA